MKLETQVVELEPGWLIIKFQGPKPPHESRPFWLHRTLTDWLTEHPGQSPTNPTPIAQWRVDGRNGLARRTGFPLGSETTISQTIVRNAF